MNTDISEEPVTSVFRIYYTGKGLYRNEKRMEMEMLEGHWEREAVGMAGLNI
jgi:hypothetical protein